MTPEEQNLLNLLDRQSVEESRAWVLEALGDDYEVPQAVLEKYGPRPDLGVEPETTTPPPKYNPEDVRGGTTLQRVGAEFKRTPEGVENFLKSEYGENNVIRDGQDELLIRDEGEESFRKFDPDSNIFDADNYSRIIKNPIGFVKEFGKEALAFIAPSVIPTASAIAGATVTSPLIASGLPGAVVMAGGAATGGAWGEGVNQEIGDMIPGEEGPSDTPNLRRKKMALTALGEGLGGHTAARGHQLADKMRPTTPPMPMTPLQRTAQANAELQLNGMKEIPMGVVEGSGQSGILRVTGKPVGTNTPIVSQAAKQSKHARENLEIMVERKLAVKEPGLAGDNIIRITGERRDELKVVRSERADKLYGDVIVKTDNQPTYHLDNLQQTINDIIGSEDASLLAPGARDDLIKIRDRMMKTDRGQGISNIDPVTGVSRGYTPKEFRSTRQTVSDWLEDPRNLTKKVSDAKAARLVKRIRQAIDLDEQAAIKAAENAGKPNVAQSMWKARAAYADDSAKIRAFDEKGLGSYVGKTENGQEMLKKFNSLVPGKKAHFLRQLPKEQADQVRGDWLHEQMAKNNLLSESTSAVGRVDVLNANSRVSGVLRIFKDGNNAKDVRAIFGNEFEPLVDLLERVDKTKFAGSDTASVLAPLLAVLSAGGGFAAGHGGLAAIGLLGSGAGLLALNTALTSNGVRKLVMRFISAKPGSTMARRILTEIEKAVAKAPVTTQAFVGGGATQVLRGTTTSGTTDE